MSNYNVAIIYFKIIIAIPSLKKQQKQNSIHTTQQKPSPIYINQYDLYILQDNVLKGKNGTTKIKQIDNANKFYFNFNE